MRRLLLLPRNLLPLHRLTGTELSLGCLLPLLDLGLPPLPLNLPQLDRLSHQGTEKKCDQPIEVCLPSWLQLLSLGI